MIKIKTRRLSFIVCAVLALSLMPIPKSFGGEIIIDARISPNRTVKIKHSKNLLKRILDLKTTTECGTVSLKDARIEEGISGTFTSANSHETAVLVSLGDHCDHLQGFVTKRLVVVRDDEIVVWKDLNGSSTIEGITDVDHDGINEIVLGSGVTSMGETQGYTELMKIHSGVWETFKNFGIVYWDNQGSSDDTHYDFASVITSQKVGKRVVFKRKNYVARCLSENSCGEYRYISSGYFPSQELIQKITTIKALPH